jgi:tetratricopeptide (TPR) repeat protein
LHDIRGNIAQAEKFYLRALKRSPDDATTNSRYAMLLYRGKNDLIAAEKRFKHSLAVKPNDVKSLVLYADFLVEAKKNYEEGAGLYQRALRLQPKSSSAMSSLKICLERISAKESAKAAAISQLQQKTTPPVSTKEGIPGDANAENSQKSIDSSLHVALFLEKRQDYAGAEDSYNECIRIDPNSVEALYAYGKFLCSVRQESIKAAEMFDAALRHNPTHLPSLVEAAKLHHLSIKDYSKADSLYRAAIELGSDHSDLLYYFGCFCKDVDKDLDRAQEYFDKQIALDENSVHIPCLYESSLINIIKKEFVEADRKLKLITTLEPTNLSALYNYAFLKMIGFKKYAAAEKLFVDVLNRDPNHAEALCNYACLQYKFRHDERKAEKYLQRLLDLDPNHIKGLFNYSVLLYNHVPHDLTSTLVEPPHSVVSSLVNDFIPHLKKTVKHLISLPDCPDSYKEKVESMLMGVSTFERSLISKTPVCPVEDSHEFVASVINIIIPSYGDEQSVKNERRSKRDLVFNSIQDETESVVVQENLNSSTGIDEFPTAELESATS